MKYDTGTVFYTHNIKHLTSIIMNQDIEHYLLLHSNGTISYIKITILNRMFTENTLTILKLKDR